MNTSDDDRILLERFRDTRSDAAFTSLVRRYLPMVFEVARRRLGSAALAEEAAQCAFTRLAAKAGAVARHPERLAAWLQRTAYCEACALARKEARLSHVPLPPAADPVKPPEIHDRLDEALAGLPERDRELVLRHCCAGEEYARLAPIFGLSPAACQKRVERALTRLARAIGRPHPAAVVAAAFAAGAMPAEALPAAEKVAAAALKSHAATATTAGVAGGMKIAACVTLAAVGGFAGWHPRVDVTAQAVEESRAAVASNGTGSRGNSRQAGTAPPRLQPVSRTLDEVLESIQTGRLGPLVEFLPQARVADLQAIIAEDDIASMGEGSEGFGTAHGLAMHRWAEIDPTGALAYAVRRDKEGSVSGELSSGVMLVWMRSEPRVAANAFLALPTRDRFWIARHIRDQDAFDSLLSLDPGIAWVMGDVRPWVESEPRMTEAEAEQIVARLFAGPQDREADAGESNRLAAAFHRLAARDFPGTLMKANGIRQPMLRTRVLVNLHSVYGSDPAGLPPGPLRTELVERDAGLRMTTDPESVIRQLRESPPGAERDALMQAAARGLVGSNPWRLLDLCASLDGPVNLPGDPLLAALEFAGRDDPRRALALLPRLSESIAHPYGLREFVEAVLSGWLRNDSEAAIRWAAGMNFRIDPRIILNAVENLRHLARLASDDNKAVRQMARWPLYILIQAANEKGNLSETLDLLPPGLARQELLRTFAHNLAANGDFDGAWRIAAMFPRDERASEILPRMALQVLRLKTDEGHAWLAGLPADDRGAIVAGLRRLLDGDGPDMGDRDEILESLARIHP